MITCIIPVYNESNNISTIYNRIIKSLDCNLVDEIIFINNSSTDQTANMIKKICDEDFKVKLVSFSRNFGYQASISAGLDLSKSEWTVIIDGDLQDPPELIEKLYNKALETESDVVYGTRKSRNDPIFKKICFWIFYRILRVFSEIKIPLDAGEFCIMNKKVVNIIKSLKEGQRFNRGLRSWVGFKQTSFDYDRDPRFSGSTKFNFSSAYELALDGLLGFSKKPLRITLLLGLIIIFLLFMYVLINLCSKFLSYLFDTSFLFTLPPGLTQTNLLIIILAAINMVFLGLIGEYIGRIYEEVKSRPRYLIKEIYQKETKQ